MARPKITLLVDTVSPFAYEAYHIIRNDPAFQICDVTYVPIFLGGLMKQCGNTAPINIKNKDKWINIERNRWAKAFSVPMRAELPPNFPPLTLGIMRALAVLDQTERVSGDRKQETLTLALDELFHQFWAEHVPVHQPENLKAVLEKVLGNDKAGKVLAAAGTDGKKLLVENTEKAFAQGAFGLPWLICTNPVGETEGFWGVDHLGQVVEFLGLKKPGDGGWRSVM